MFSALFDLRFERLITRKLLGVIYGITVAVIVIAGLVAAIAFIASGGAGIAVGLIAVPVVTFLYLLLARVAAEAVVVYFRIGEDVRAIRDRSLV